MSITLALQSHRGEVMRRLIAASTLLALAAAPAVALTAEPSAKLSAKRNGAGEVVAHLDRADPPSGRCERAAVAVNRH